MPDFQLLRHPVAIPRPETGDRHQVGSGLGLPPFKASTLKERYSDLAIELHLQNRYLPLKPILLQK